MKEYIHYVLPHKKLFKSVSINRRELSDLENFVIKYLKVKDLNELRDRFEGQTFLDNYLQKAVPLLGLQKYLKTDLVDFENISPDKIKPAIVIDGKRVNVIQFEDCLPLIDTSNNLPCIFVYSTQKQMLELCGFASAETVKNYILDVKRYGFGSKETIKGTFYGFDKLKMFKSIEDLVELLKP